MTDETFWILIAASVYAVVGASIIIGSGIEHDARRKKEAAKDRTSGNYAEQTDRINNQVAKAGDVA